MRMIDDDFTPNEKEDYRRKTTDDPSLDAFVDDFEYDDEANDRNEIDFGND